MNAQVFPILIRREFWEHRVLWMAPLAAVAVFILLCLVVGTANPASFHVDARHVGSSAGSFVLGMQAISTVLLFALTSLVLFFYLTDCLYAERKDRSILFWKSLPVSDSATVVSKLVVALLLVPVGVYVLGTIANLLGFGILWLRFHNDPAVGPWVTLDPGSWLHTTGVMAVDILIVALWYAPLAGYQLLVSAWAKSSVFVWTILPPLLLAVAERLTLGTWNVLAWIASHLFFGMFGIAQEKRIPRADLLNRIDAAGLVTDPEFWIGLVVAALLVFAAIRIRRYRDDT
jgi:ABC-2 type transport system permease protein